jgi:hypothetical protein
LSETKAKKAATKDSANHTKKNVLEILPNDPAKNLQVLSALFGGRVEDSAEVIIYSYLLFSEALISSFQSDANKSDSDSSDEDDPEEGAESNRARAKQKLAQKKRQEQELRSREVRFLIALNYPR